MVLRFNATSSLAGPDMTKPGDQSDIVVERMTRLTKSQKRAAGDGRIVFENDEEGIDQQRMLVCENQARNRARFKQGGIYHVEWMDPNDPDAERMSRWVEGSLDSSHREPSAPECTLS